MFMVSRSLVMLRLPTLVRAALGASFEGARPRWPRSPEGGALAVLNIARWCVLMLLVLIAGSGGRLSVPGGKSHEVVAPLLAVGIGPTYACKLIDLSYPPAGCGGVLLGRVHISQVPGVFRLHNSTISPPPLGSTSFLSDIERLRGPG